MDNML